MKTSILIILSLVLLAAGSVFAVEVAAPQPAAPVAPALASPANTPVATTASYKLTIDDVLRLSVWGEQNLTDIPLTVTPEGTINAPVVGTIAVVGLTLDEVSKEIGKRFVDKEYLVNPVIQLTLYSVHKLKVRVLGQVQKPGLTFMREGETVDQAVAEAGGFITDMANLAKTTLTRQTADGQSETIKVDLAAYYYDGNVSQNLKIQEGDTIYIPEDVENRYYVAGYVAQPRMFALKRNSTVMDAITTAGGPVQRAALGRTVVIRKNANGIGTTKIKVDVGKMYRSGDRSHDFKLQAGDTVYVPETTAPDWTKIGSVLNIATSWSYLNRLGFF